MKKIFILIVLVFSVLIGCKRDTNPIVEINTTFSLNGTVFHIIDKSLER